MINLFRSTMTDKITLAKFLYSNEESFVGQTLNGIIYGNSGNTTCRIPFHLNDKMVAVYLFNHLYVVDPVMSRSYGGLTIEFDEYYRYQLSRYFKEFSSTDVKAFVASGLLNIKFRDDLISECDTYIRITNNRLYGKNVNLRLVK